MSCETRRPRVRPPHRASSADRTSWGRAFGGGSKWRFWLFEGAIQDSRSIRINHPTASAVTVRVRRQRQSCERTVIHSLSQLAQNVFLCFIISSSGICWSVALGASPPPPRPPPSSSPCIDPSGLASGDRARIRVAPSKLGRWVSRAAPPAPTALLGWLFCNHTTHPTTTAATRLDSVPRTTSERKTAP